MTTAKNGIKQHSQALNHYKKRTAHRLRREAKLEDASE